MLELAYRLSERLRLAVVSECQVDVKQARELNNPAALHRTYVMGTGSRRHSVCAAAHVNIHDRD